MHRDVIPINGGSSGSFVSSDISFQHSIESKTSISKIRLASYFIAWYFFTIVFNVANKRLLNDVQLPFTVTLLQFIIGCGLYLPSWANRKSSLNRAQVIKLNQLGVCHGFGSLATNVALSLGSISFVHVIKAGEPLMAALFSFFFLHQNLSWRQGLALLPIVFGISLASAKDISFSWSSLCAAMISNVFYQLRIVLAKKEIHNTDNSLSSIELYRAATIFGTIPLIPLALIFEGETILLIWNQFSSGVFPLQSVAVNLVISSLSYHFYNEVAFWILDYVSPTTHAIGGALKRVVIILASVVFLGTPLSFESALGSLIAVLGTYLYSS